MKGGLRFFFQPLYRPQKETLGLFVGARITVVELQAQKEPTPHHPNPPRLNQRPFQASRPLTHPPQSGKSIRAASGTSPGAS
jgi:hypothetical protein